MPWGPWHVLLGIILALVATAVAIVVAGGIVVALGHDPVPEDAGDAFAKAGRILEYADERLAAASRGERLPSPPVLFGNEVAARVFYSFGAVSAALLAAAAIIASRRSPGRFARAVGLDRVDWRGLWLPFVLTIGAYVGVVAYSVAVELSGIDLLIPEDQVPRLAYRDDVSFAIFGFIALVTAPAGEEIFYRGLLFAGLARWGFWPAALGSGLLFAVSHVDPGLYLPFTAVGVAAAWLYWRSGSLWQAIAFHALFNGVSLLLLAVTR